MKVICIHEGNYCYNERTGRNVNKTGNLIIGEYYTVVNHDRKFGILFYELQEMPSDVYFESEMFAPVSDIDETEMERDWMLVKTEAYDTQRT